MEGFDVRRGLATVAAVVALGATACAPTTGTPVVDGGDGGDGLSLEGGTWVLTDGTVTGTPLEVPAGHRVSLTVDGAQAGGTAACNSYGATVAVDGDEVRFLLQGMTEMGCEPAVMEAEAAYVDALPQVTSATRDDDRLTLRGSDVQLRFTLEPPVPTESLVGTTWVLDTILEGETASSVRGEPAILRLTDDGTLTGGTGCRSLSGEYTVTGDEVLFTTFSADGECPPDLADQDGHVVTVLGDGFRVRVDGDRLTVTSDGGMGLSYRASDG